MKTGSPNETEEMRRCSLTTVDNGTMSRVFEGHKDPNKTVHQTNKACCSQTLTSFTAIIYAILSSVCFSSNAVLVRYCRHVHPGQMALYRFVGMLVFSLPIAIHEDANLLGPKTRRPLLAYRAIVCTVTVICSFYSFRYLPVGVASVIYYSTPVFVTIFARVTLKESCDLLQSASVLVAVVGIVLIVNPGNLGSRGMAQAQNDILGISFGLIGMIMLCVMVVITRKARDVHFSVVSVTTSVPGALSCLLFTVLAGEFSTHSCGIGRLTGLALGLFNFLGQTLYIRAIQLENVGPVATVKAAGDMVLAVAWQLILFGEPLDSYAIAGTLLVIGSLILVGVRKWAASLPEESNVRKYMCSNYSF